MLIDRPARSRATLVLAHGAGLPMDAPFMQAIAMGLLAHRVTVVRFEFPYMAARRQTGKQAPPNRMPVLEQTLLDVVAGLPPVKRLFLGGKSMGGRVATQLADRLGVRGVIALGYPFHPPEQPQKQRVAHLSTLRTPCLIVQGTRDPLGTPAEIATYPLARSIALHWLEDGDHSFEPRRSSGRTLEQNLAEAIVAMADFMRAN